MGLPKSGIFKIDYGEKEGKLMPEGKEDFLKTVHNHGLNALFETFRYYSRKEPQMFRFDTGRNSAYENIAVGTLKNSLSAYDFFKDTDDIRVYYISIVHPLHAGLCRIYSRLELGRSGSEEGLEKRRQNNEHLLPEMIIFSPSNRNYGVGHGGWRSYRGTNRNQSGMISRDKAAALVPGDNKGLNAVMAEMQRHYKKLFTP